MMARRSIALSPAWGPAWSRRVWIPGAFAGNLSKNRHKTIVYIAGRARIGLTDEYRNALPLITVPVRQALRGAPLRMDKLWVSVMVHKPDHRSDSANLIDGVLDGIQSATYDLNGFGPRGLNDRWYSVIVDWCIDSAEPGLEIKLWQE